MSRHRDAQRRSLDYCPETCPAVDAALEKIKEVGTYKMREALNQACQDLLDAEARIAELESERAYLLDQIDDLTTE